MEENATVALSTTIKEEQQESDKGLITAAVQVFAINDHEVIMTPHTFNLPHALIFEEFRDVVGPALHKVHSGV